MFIAILLAALLCAVLIVGPGQILYRILQLGGAVLLTLGAWAVMIYVVPVILAAILCTVGFVALVGFLVHVLSPSDEEGPGPKLLGRASSIKRK